MSYSRGLWGAVAISLGLAGCVQPQASRTTVKLVSDQFATGVTINGIPNQNSDVDLNWMIQSLVDQHTGVVNHGIFAEWTYSGHSVGKYTAADDTARPLPVKILNRDYCAFDSCARDDTLDIGIDEATLRARADKGFEIKLSAQDGSWGILDITPQMIRAQLDAEDKLLAGMAARDTAAASSRPPLLNLPYNPNAPGDQKAPSYSVKESGIGIGGIPMLMSKIRPGAADGLMVSHVEKGSPAYLAGIKIGDVMTSFDGHSLSDVLTAADVFSSAADQVVAKSTPGTAVPIELRRGTTSMKVILHLQ